MSAWYPLVRNRSDFSTRVGVSRRPSRNGFSPSSASSCATSFCIQLLYRIALSTLALSPAWPASTAEDADALYAQRADLTKAVRSAELWQSAIDRNPSDFDAAWKRARAGYWIG